MGSVILASKLNILALFTDQHCYDRSLLSGIYDAVSKKTLNWHIHLADPCELEHYSHLYQWQGMLLNGDVPQYSAWLEKFKLPAAAACGFHFEYPFATNISYVYPDNEALVRQVVDHFRAGGLTQVAFFSGFNHQKPDWIYSRQALFKSIASDSGLEYLQLPSANLDLWLKELENPIGIMAANDVFARHLINVCEKLNIGVPEKVSVVGVDNDDIENALTPIPITTLELDPHRIGYRLVQELRSRLTKLDDKSPRHIAIAPKHFEIRLSGQQENISDPLVAQAMRFISCNYHLRIKAEQVVDFCGVSRTKLDQLFNDSFGKTVHTVIAELRLSKAETLLSDTNLPISDVALKIGYPSVQYLYNVFAKNYQCTPVQYRHRHQSKKPDRSC